MTSENNQPERNANCEPKPPRPPRRGLRAALIAVLAVAAVAIGVGGSYWYTRYRVPSEPGPASIHVETESNTLGLPASGFRFAVLGDMPADVGAARTAPLRDALTWQPDFMLNMGDVVAYAKPENWREFIGLIAELVPPDLPYYHTPGNHDVDHNAFGYHPGFVKHYFGRRWYHVNAGEWRFIFLDTARMKISERRMRWLEALLADAKDSGRSAALVTHAPPRKFEADSTFKGEDEREHAMKSKTTRRLAEIVKDYDVRAIFAGHFNRTMQFEWQGVPVYVTGMDDDAWDHGPVGYHRIEVHGKELQVDCVWLYEDGRRRVERLHAP